MNFLLRSEDYASPIPRAVDWLYSCRRHLGRREDDLDAGIYVAASPLPMHAWRHLICSIPPMDPPHVHRC